MEEIILKYEVSCPWCGKGRSYLSEDGVGYVSMQCARCGHFYVLNLRTTRTMKTMRLSRMLRPVKR